MNFNIIRTICSSYHVAGNIGRFHRGFASNSMERVYHGRIAKLTNVFKSLMPSKLRIAFENDLKIVATASDPIKYAEKALQFACNVRGVLYESGVKQGEILDEFDGGIWHKEQKKVGDSSVPLSALIPEDSNKYLSVTAEKVVKYLKMLPLDQTVNFFEIGCLSCHDMSLIKKDLFKESSEVVEKYFGMDIHKPALVVAAAINKVECWSDSLMLLHADAALEGNYHLFPQKDRKFVFCNKLISAMPPKIGLQALENIANFLCEGDFALINFTLNDRAAKPILRMVKRGEKYELKEVDGISVISENGSVIQSIYNRSILTNEFRRLGLDLVKYEMINELKESKNNSHVSSDAIRDGYNRGVFCFVKKRKTCYSSTVNISETLLGGHK